MMRRFRPLIIGTALGSLLAFLFDPARGRSRRRQLMQRATGIARRSLRQQGRQVSRAASRVNGLKQRVAHRRVADPDPSAEKLKARVQSELFRATDVPKGDLNVNVENRVVMLRGHVDSEAMRARLEAQARHVQGVKGVENFIRVLP